MISIIKNYLILFVMLLISTYTFATIILVSNYTSNKITAYELSTGEELGLPFPIIDDLANPLGLAVTKNKTHLYVSNQSSGTINLYDLSTGQKIRTFLSNLSYPSGITLNSDDTILYVANFGGYVESYDTLTGSNIKTYSSGIYGCSDVALSPDETKLYVSNFNGHNITIYNVLTTNELNFSPIQTSGSVSAVDISLDGNILYVCNQSTQTIEKYNALTGAIITNPFLDASDDLNSPYGMKLSLDGSTLYVGNTSNNLILAFNSSTGEQITFPFPISTDIVFPASFAFGLSSISPPTNLCGYQDNDDFGLEYEIFNQLSWNASPSEILGYYVYKNGVKIATLDNYVLNYTDHNQKKGVKMIYSVTAFDQAGNESQAINCIIK